MGTPQVCFGDSEVYLTHIGTRRVVGCVVGERRPGSGGGAQGALLGSEVNRMFAFTVTRASEEESVAAVIMERSHDIMRQFVHKYVAIPCIDMHTHHIAGYFD